MKSTMKLVEVWVTLGALSVAVLLVQGSSAYRLQQQKRDGSSFKGTLTSVNHEKSKSAVGGGSTGIISSGGGSKLGGGAIVGGGGLGGGGEVSVWPPRLPMWGFLPQSSSHSSSHQQIKSKSESSKEEGEEDSHTHHHPSSSVFLDEDDEPWLSHLKRSSGGGGGGVKRTRNYDVPQIECPPADDGMERFACPTPDNLGRYRCVDDHVLCDGFVDCPGREDEDRQACMFYKTTKAHLDVLADALLRWARGKR